MTARGWEDLSSLMQVYEKLDLPVDESVIREFIHHEDVAEDAAAYLNCTASTGMITGSRISLPEK